LGILNLKINNITHAKIIANKITLYIKQNNIKIALIHKSIHIHSLQITKFINYIYKLTQHQPYNYIIKQTTIMGFNISINHNTFIPKIDTESIIEKILTHIIDKKKTYKCIDIFSGSGCIAISLSLLKKNIFIYAIDIHINAIKNIKNNINTYKLNKHISIIKYNCLKFSNIKTCNTNKHIIIANPPYILPKHFQILPKHIQYYEPKLSLIHHKTNIMLFYKIILQYAYKILHINGKLIFEIDIKQNNNFNKINNKQFKIFYFFKDKLGFFRGCMLH